MTSTGKYLPLFFVALAAVALFGQPLFVSKASKDLPLQETSAANGPTTPDSSGTSATSVNQSTSSQTSLKDSYGKLPMSFERNLRQTDETVKFFSHGHGYNLFLTPAEAVFVLSTSTRGVSNKGELEQNPKRGKERRRQTADVLRIKLKDANSQAYLEGLNEL